ncbi:ATP synthase F1 subunit gamma [Candidatus Saccharibacteria bacterium]|nr:MAG: ATP synthase F1 subunit gamma [Candidatus Saccharibacteria bacterium]
MPSTRQLKSRIRSVKSNKQITKAMELVAASKLRKSQDASRASQAYALAARELLTQLGRLSDVQQFAFFKKREVKSRLIILITSDRGLAGAYNANVIKQFVAVLNEDEKNHIKTQVICVGRRGAQFAARLAGVEVVGVYTAMPDVITANDFRPILVEAVDRFIDEVVDSVDIITTRFLNSFTQVAETLPLLPAVFEEAEVSKDVQLARFEPSIEVVLEGATVRLLESQLYQALLDAKASEHSMRRAAMKNATDNATELVDDLTLEMNKVRQAAITQELSEISAGVEAMK